MGDWIVKFKDGKRFVIDSKYSLCFLNDNAIAIVLNEYDNYKLNNPMVHLGYINFNEVRYILNGDNIVKPNGPY